MNLLAADSPLAAATGYVVIAIFGGSVAVWAAILFRLVHGIPVLRHEPRRHVPWNGGDVLLLVFAYFFITIVVMTIFQHFDRAKDKGAGTQSSAAPGPISGDAHNHLAIANVNDDEKRGHPLMPLFNSHDGALIALGIFLAVIKAPLIEEFFFRVILQGWLESAWIRSRRTKRRLLTSRSGEVDLASYAGSSDNPYMPPQTALDDAIPSGYFAWLHRYKIGRFVPVLLPAIFFAMLHFRFGREPAAPTQVASAFLAQSVAEAIWLALTLFVLIGVRGATARDLGWSLRRVGYDLLLGITAMLAVIAPVLLFSGLLETTLRHYNIPISGDPVPIFFLALALGTLYRRTHRIMPSLVLHMGLNGSSVLLFYLQSTIGP